jgi:metallophosphoesterase (TIGR00282 family)
VLEGQGYKDKVLRLLFLGDVVGRPGRRVVLDELPRLIKRYELDFVIVNGENAAGGFGITESIANELFEVGANVITTGNHIWDQRETLSFIDREHRLLRPANYPAGTAGRGSGLFEARNGAQVLVVNLMGRVFMHDLDCPFQCIAEELEACPLGRGADAVFVDFHAEATSEKQGLAYFLDGKVSAVIGTHTHVPTADDRLLPNGTAYQSDAGMCGVYDSVLGMDKDEPVSRFLTRMNGGRFAPAAGQAALCGVAMELDDRTGLAVQVSPVRLGPGVRQIEPSFWVASGEQQAVPEPPRKVVG